ncbi:gypsy/ty3 retroelement polyprotein [Tanacetum coccineum]
MLAPSGGGLILYQACGNLYAMTGKNRVNSYAIRITKIISGIEDRHHGPSDAMHNPSKPLKVSQKILVSLLAEINILYIDFLTSTRTFRVILFSVTVTNGNPSSVNIKQHCGRYRILHEALTIFMDITLAIKLGCKFVNTKPMMVKVPGGKKVLCNHMLKGFEWKMRNITFSADVYLMSLRGSDMVLGIQWFSTPGIMQFDFLNHTMKFEFQGKKVILIGSNEDQIRNIREGQKSKREEEKPNFQIQIPTRKSSSTLDIQYLLNEYQDTFQDPKGLPPFRKGFNHKILLKEGSNPIDLRTYRYYLLQKDVTEKLTQELLEQGTIQTNNNAFASPVVLVKKKMAYGGCV